MATIEQWQAYADLKLAEPRQRLEQYVEEIAEVDGRRFLACAIDISAKNKDRPRAELEWIALMMHRFAHLFGHWQSRSVFVQEEKG